MTTHDETNTVLLHKIISRSKSRAERHHRSRFRPATVAADPTNDFHAYNPATVTWFDLSGHALGTPPTARFGHGFTSAGGKLYVHGGSKDHGEHLGSFLYYRPGRSAWEFVMASLFPRDRLLRHGPP